VAARLARMPGPGNDSTAFWRSAAAECAALRPTVPMLTRVLLASSQIQTRKVVWQIVFRPLELIRSTRQPGKSTSHLPRPAVGKMFWDFWGRTDLPSRWKQGDHHAPYTERVRYPGQHRDRRGHAAKVSSQHLPRHRARRVSEGSEARQLLAMATVRGCRSHPKPFRAEV